MRALPDPIRTIRYDMRGHGLTAASAPPYTIRDLAQDLERLIDALKVSRVTLCGISVGGMVAMQFAEDRPEQIERLVLCDTAYRIGPPAMWNERIAAVVKSGVPTVSNAVIERWFSSAFRSTRPADVAGYRRMLEQCTVDGYAGVCAAIRDADLEPVARQIRCPTLVVCGSGDQATPPELNKALAASIPNARFVSIEGAAHLPCIEEPAILAGRLASFLGEHQHV